MMISTLRCLLLWIILNIYGPFVLLFCRLIILYPRSVYQGLFQQQSSFCLLVTCDRLLLISLFSHFFIFSDFFHPLWNNMHVQRVRVITTVVTGTGTSAVRYVLFLTCTGTGSKKFINLPHYFFSFHFPYIVRWSDARTFWPEKVERIAVICSNSKYDIMPYWYYHAWHNEEWGW